MRKQIEIINELKNFWGVNEFSFEAQYALNKKGNGFFRNLRKISDKSKIFMPNGSQLTVGVPKELKFEEDKSYLISVFVPNDEIRTKFENDYTILLDTKKSPPKALESAPESYVKSLEREYNSVIGIGLDSLKGAIKRISYDINRKPETFIFELLQNADDYPDKKIGRVIVSFKIVGEYLVFQHNGLPFSGNNVRALCSVDAGDKEYDFEKIGYKGIGFKSIFKHSNYVVIHSGGYTFKFDENYHRSQGIDTFWQLIPIWTDLSELPEIVQNQVGNNFNVTVIIKPEEGNSQLKSYEGTFNAIFRDERVLLFLRHVEHFSFRGATTNILKRRDSDSWIISKLDAVIVPDELQKIINAKIKVDDRIPQKYEDIEKTVLTFATRKIEGKITSTEQAHLYAYLPTDLDFGFPFLLNGDFIPDGGRHYLHADLEWNQFLFREAGKNLLKWIAALWSENNDIGAYNMLPDEKKLVSERPGDEKEILLKCFLDGLSEEKNATKFIAIETNKLVTVNEIVLDDTGLFSKGILPNSFYYEISNSTKKLPHPNINLERLYSSYLELEKFTSKQLLDLLSNDENKAKLKEVIIQIEISKYLDFLSWFNTFCYLNSVPNVWLLSLPIVLTKDDTFSLSNVLSNGHFIFKNKRTRNIEELLRKVGFELSSVYIDDQNYQYLYGILLQQESYLKSDVKLYEHIAAAKDLSKLTALEKNTLIAFFESLVDVGPAKYAKALPLFKSKKKEGSLKPLNSLISKTCEGLPTWLNDFVIDADEEKALGATFQAQLLNEKDLLEKLFCNLESYNEIIDNINSENLEEFYTYILKLNKKKPEETKIDYSALPIVFIEEDSKFVLASTAFWPESITKLTPSKYESVKSVIETISDERLPHFAALQIKAPFALGGKELNLVEIAPKTNSLDVLAINDFLDWVEANGEKEFLNHFSFSVIDEKLLIGKSSGSKYYHTTDESLIAFIEASAINTKLSLFPKELYSKDRNKIGLLEGVPLLTYLIENGLANVELVKFVQSANDTQLSLQYLELLSELNIDSSKTYTLKDDEFKILKLVTTQIIDDSEKLDSFREKVSLDNVKLLEKAVSADIRMFDENKKFHYQLKTLELSHVLPQYSGKTYPVSEIIELFIDFKDNESLKKVFRAKPHYTERIFKELIELKKEVYNAAQTFFLSYYQFLFPSQTILNDKNFFAINPEIDGEAYEKELTQFLDYCLNENGYIEFISQEIIQSFFPKNIVSSEDYAIDDEKIPTWLSNWINAADTDKKNAFIKSLGVNDDESHVVLYRKAIKESQMETMDFNRENIDTDSLLINTLKWLSIELNSKQLTLCKEVLQPLYKTLSNRGIFIENLPFPSLKYYNIDSYSLQIIKEGDEIHIINENWGEFKEAIFNHLITDKLVTDDVLPKAYRDEWNVIEQAFEKLPNVEDLVAKSYVYNEEFYQEWDLKNQYNIQVYKGDKIPYLINYNGCLIKEISEGFAVYISNAYYVVESVKVNPFTFLSQLPEFKDIQALRAQKQLFEEKKLETEGGITFTPEQIEAWHALFDNDIPESYKKNYNLASLVAALEALPKFGYKIDKARTNLKETHEYAQLDPVFDSDGNVYTVMSRSARGGLLYLTRKAWDRLESEPNTFLFADFGNGKSNLFKSKQDILDVNEKHTDYQILRIETEAVASNVDSILNGTFDNSKIWIIFRVNENKEFDRLYYKDYEPNQGEVNTANLGNSTKINTW
jgi:hypothetical protein